MATATSPKPAAKKAAAKKVPAKKAPANKAGPKVTSLPDAAHDIEKAIADAMHRELKAAKKMLEGLERDVRGIIKRVEKTVDELSGKTTSAAKKAPAKKAPAKKAAKRSPAKK